MVAGGEQCAPRSTITPSKTCSANMYRCIKRRMGHSLKRTHCKRVLVTARKQAAYKLSGTKSSLPSFKRVLVATDNTTVVSYINKEEGMMSGPLCGSYCGESETGDSQSPTHSRPTECGSEISYPD